MIELQQAELMGFLRTLLILAFIYYAFKFLARLFAPYLMRKAVDKMKQQAEKQYGNQQRENRVPDGETVIDKRPQQGKKSNDDVGEYIEFEEID